MVSSVATQRVSAATCMIYLRNEPIWRTVSSHVNSRDTAVLRTLFARSEAPILTAH